MHRSSMGHLHQLFPMWILWCLILLGSNWSFVFDSSFSQSLQYHNYWKLIFLSNLAQVGQLIWKLSPASHYLHSETVCLISPGEMNGNELLMLINILAQKMPIFQKTSEALREKHVFSHANGIGKSTLLHTFCLEVLVSSCNFTK